MNQNVCRKNKIGYCFFGEKCHLRHVDEVCKTENCDVVKCEKRHPRTCKFMRDYGRCKFTTYCKFDHQKCTNISDNAKKLADLEKQLERIQNNNSAEIEKISNDKFDILGKKCETIVKTLEEKDFMIQNLENNIRIMEEAFENKLKNLEKIVKHEQTKNESLRLDLKTLEIESEVIHCEHCDFTTSSNKGFKTHMKRKHSVKNSEKVAFKCEVCEFESNSKLGLKRHMKSHSYIFEDKKCKCNDCDFTGNNAWTVQIHHGKVHNKNIECGLCDFQSKDLDTLNLHLKTCEIYECNECEFVAKQISNIKKHVKNNIKCKDTMVYHVKIDRDNDEEATVKEYQLCELF